MVSASFLKTADFKISVWTQKYLSLHIFWYTRVVTRNPQLDSGQSFRFSSNQRRKIQRKRHCQTLRGSCILLCWNQKGKKVEASRIFVQSPKPANLSYYYKFWWRKETQVKGPGIHLLSFHLSLQRDWMGSFPTWNKEKLAVQSVALQTWMWSNRIKLPGIFLSRHFQIEGMLETIEGSKSVWRNWETSSIFRLLILSSEERLRELGLFSLQKGRLEEILSIYINTWREDAMSSEPGSFQRCPVMGQEAVGTNWNTGGSIWTLGNLSLLCRWWSTGTGCSERLWSFSLQRFGENSVINTYMEE